MVAGPARAAVAAIMMGLAMPTALAQPAPASPPAVAPASSSSASSPSSAVPPGGDNPGLMDQLGAFWDKSSSMLPGLLPADGSAAKPAEPAPPATAPAPASQAAVSGAPLPARPAPTAPPAPAPAVAPPASDSSLVPSMVSGRVQCPTASDGAADCKTGADQLCRSKGFREGKSLTTDSAEACSAKALIPGRPREPGDCHTNYFVTRAFCS